MRDGQSCKVNRGIVHMVSGTDLSESLKVGIMETQELGVTTSIDFGDFQSKLSKRGQGLQGWG